MGWTGVARKENQIIFLEKNNHRQVGSYTNDSLLINHVISLITVLSYQRIMQFTDSSQLKSSV